MYLCIIQVPKIRDSQSAIKIMNDQQKAKASLTRSLRLIVFMEKQVKTRAEKESIHHFASFSIE